MLTSVTGNPRTFRIAPSQTMVTQVDEIVGIPKPKVCLQVSTPAAAPGPLYNVANAWENVFGQTGQVVDVNVRNLIEVEDGLVPPPAKNSITIEQTGDYYINLTTSLSFSASGNGNTTSLRIFRTEPDGTVEIEITQVTEYYDNNNAWTMGVAGVWPLNEGDNLRFEYSSNTAPQNIAVLVGTTVTAFRLL